MGMVDWLALRGIEPVFIDNGSDYKPLLDYYKTTPYQVIQLNVNHGHTCVWIPELKIFERLGIKDRYIVSDPDLDLTSVPDDFLSVMNEGLNKYPHYSKCGLSLEINDLPPTEEGYFIRYRCEAQYWKDPLDNMYFRAATDTTIALYREDCREYTHSAIRTNRPYTARHLPWYYTDFKLLSEEEQNYFRSASDSSSGKKRLLK